MKRKWGKLVAILLIVTSMIFICANSYAHSGRTDSSGGHKDNKNKSGLGYYHYHCGGHPAHLHKNGICPYSKSSSGSKKSTSNTKKSSSSNKNTKTSSDSQKTSTSITKQKTSSAPKKASTDTKSTTSKNTKTSANIVKNENNTNTINTTTEDSSAGGTLVALGLLGGGSYLGYKKYKKSKD